MSSKSNEPTAEELEILRKDFLSRCALAAFCHLKQIDATALSVLQSIGVSAEVEGSADYRSILPALKEEPGARLELGPGPLILAALDEGAAVITVSDLLGVPDRGVRLAALAYFRGLPEPGECLLPSTRRALAALAEPMADDASWVRSSMTADELLEHDWYLSLRGLERGLELGDAKLIDVYYPRVIRPSLQSIYAILDFLDSKRKVPGPARSSSLEERLGIFLEEKGHLILESQGLYDLVGGSAGLSDKTSDLKERLWRWGSTSPLAAFHVCLFLAQSPELVADGKNDELWEKLSSSLSMSDPSEEESIYSNDWGLVTFLARHYCLHLESRLPDRDSTSRTELAWWLAMRASRVLTDGRLSASIDDSALRRSYEEALSEWFFVRVPVEPNVLRTLTRLIPDPLTVLILCRLGKSIAQWKPDDLGDEAELAFSQGLAPLLLAGTPVLGSDLPGEEAIGSRFVDTARSWARALSSADAMEEFKTLVEFSGSFCSRDRLAEHVRRLPEVTEDERAATVQALRAAAFSQADLSPTLWPYVVNETWWERVFDSSPMWVIEPLIDSLLEIELRTGPERSVTILHKLVGTVESSTLEADDGVGLVDFIIVASVAAQSTSAIRRLVEAAKREPGLMEPLSRWQVRLRRRLSGADALLSSRIRPVLSALGGL